MPKLPIVTADQLIKALQRIDFHIVRQKGSHVRMKHEVAALPERAMGSCRG